jgi:hypothetical protein
MKKAIILLCFALPVLAGCSKLNESRAKDFTHSGCAAGTRADAFSDDKPSLLILKYENGNLRVIRQNATMNCSIKERGLVCSAFVKGNALVYQVDYDKAGEELRCVCPVEEMTSLVIGLKEGEEYTFEYCGIDRDLPRFSFTFDKDLYLVKDVDSLFDSED